MARNSKECLEASAIWSREDLIFPAYREHGVNLPFNHIQVGFYADFRWCFD